METMRCKSCGGEYPATTEYFHPEKLGKNGLRARCKSCLRRKQADYRAANVETLTGSHAYSKKKAFWQAASARKAARKRNLPATLTTAEWQYALDYFDNQCAVCGCSNRKLALDHWIPLSDPRTDNPGTVAKNAVPLCHDRRGCNIGKRNKPAEQWLSQRYGDSHAQEILRRIQAYFDSLKEYEGE